MHAHALGTAALVQQQLPRTRAPHGGSGAKPGRGPTFVRLTTLSVMLIWWCGFSACRQGRLRGCMAVMQHVCVCVVGQLGRR